MDSPAAPKSRNDGKQFEALIAWLHEKLKDRATIERDVHLPSRFGEGTRQVDIAIRIAEGKLRLLAIIECKDHRRRIGPSTVDTVAGTRRDVGANTALLVSRSGFTDGARRRADDAEVTLLTYAEACEAAWEDLFSVADAPFLLFHGWLPQYVELLDSADDAIVLSASVQAAIGRDPDTPVLCDPTGRPLLSLARLAGDELVWATKWRTHQDTALNGPVREVTHAFRFETPLWAEGLGGLLQPVWGFRVCAKAWRERQVPLWRDARYTDESTSEQLARVISAEGKLGGRPYRFDMLEQPSATQELPSFTVRYEGLDPKESMEFGLTMLQGGGESVPT